MGACAPSESHAGDGSFVKQRIRSRLRLRVTAYKLPRLSSLSLHSVAASLILSSQGSLCLLVLFILPLEGSPSDNINLGCLFIVDF